MENKIARLDKYCRTILQPRTDSRKVVPKPPLAVCNSFASLVVEDPSCEDEVLLVQKSSKPVPKQMQVPVQPPLATVACPSLTVRKGKCWADLEEDEDVTASASASATASAVANTDENKKSWANVVVVGKVEPVKKMAVMRVSRTSRWSRLDNMPMRGGRDRSSSPDDEW
jgi:hypothetical protein